MEQDQCFKQQSVSRWLHNYIIGKRKSVIIYFHKESSQIIRTMALHALMIEECQSAFLVPRNRELRGSRKRSLYDS